MDDTSRTKAHGIPTKIGQEVSRKKLQRKFSRK